MAAPTPTARSAPSGSSRQMPDGFTSKITLANKAGIAFWEKTVKPPGIDGGEPIEQSTMFNTHWHTFAPRTLIKLEAVQVEAAYDPDVIADIISIVNSPTTITVSFADNSTICFFGWLQKFEPAALKEGELPMASITFHPSNYDPSGKVEAGPVFTAAAGT